MTTRRDVETRLQRIETSLRPPEERPDQRGTRITIHELMERLLVPGCSLALIDDGEIIVAKGYGVTEQSGQTPVGTRTIFQACSISKAVAGVGALRLVQDGLLALDDDVNDYLNTWQIPANGGWQPRVTLRHLLTHTAGLSYNWFPGHRRGAAAPTALQTVKGEAPANTPPVRVVGLPGSEFSYSGAHYAVLQLLMEEVTGEAFPALMERLIFEPLGMRDSSYDQSFPETRPEGVALGHDAAGVPLSGDWHTQPEYAGAGLWTPPGDLCRLALEIQRARAGASTTLLSQEIATEMLTPGPGNRGLGWQLRPGDGWLWFGHGGDNVGYKCLLLADAERGRAAAVMTNGDGGWLVCNLILEIVRDEYGWPDVVNLDGDLIFRAPEPAEVTHAQSFLAACVGTYRLATGLMLQIESGKDGLTLRAGDQPPMALLPVSAATFLAAAANATLTFELDDDGNAPALRFRHFGDEIAGERMP